MADPYGTPPRNSSPSRNSHSQEVPSDDDADLLELLMLGHVNDSSNNNSTVEEASLHARLQQMHSRLSTDMGPMTWWARLLTGAEAAGFAVSVDKDAVGAGGSSAGASAPAAFQSPEGKLHLQALMDTCDVSEGRAVQLTCSTMTCLLREDALEADVEAVSCLLGTRRLLDECVCRYKVQFVERIRIVLECLRIDQEGRADNTDDDADGDDTEETTAAKATDIMIGKAVSDFLSTVDSQTKINRQKRGLFSLLLTLALAPLPPVFNGHVSYSANRLSGNEKGGAFQNNNEKEEAAATTASWMIPTTIRKEALESLLILLYDRLENGVSRLDLMLLLIGVESCNSNDRVNTDICVNSGLECMEFGLSCHRYVQIGGLDRSIATTTRRRGRESLEILSLNGLWGLVFAECMGLWRTNADNWRMDHPLLVGLNHPVPVIEDGQRDSGGDTPTMGLTGRRLGMTVQDDSNDEEGLTQPQKELESIYIKLVSAGETLRDRRRVAYKSRKRPDDTAVGDDDDDELYGVQGPEGVALLSFGLLLQLVRSCGNGSDGYEDRLSKWGSECARMANDDCAAFAYLERVLDGVVVDPLEGMRDGLCVRLGRGRGDGAEIVSVLAGRRDISMLADVESMALMDEDGARDEGDDPDLIDGFAVDASSIINSSIGREILAATIRVFRQSLLSLQSSSAVDNIGMLVDLAAIIYRHSTPLCDQFWSDWNEFSSAMTDEGATPSSSDESMCFLLETAHNLAQSTLNELVNGGRQEAIMKYLRPMSSFLHLISSLCSSSTVLHNVLDSGFLPEGLVSKTVSICNALAPMASALNESIEPVTSDDRRTIHYATVALESIATIAYLGKQSARDWLRTSLASAGHPRMLFAIASNAMPRKNGDVTQECSDLASSALNLLSELLVGASVSFYIEASECFASSKTFVNSTDSAFSYFFRGIQSKVTLSAASILSRLAVNLEQNAFDESVYPRSICVYIETLRDGVINGLEVLASLFSGGEVMPFTSQTQMDVTYSILLSTVATLMGVKSVMYLNKDANVRLAALSVRDDIIGILASSTALGQVIGYLSVAPITLSKSSLARELTCHTQEDESESSSDNSKYGAWARFVTPKRASEKSLQRQEEKEANPEKGISLGGEDTSPPIISEMALSLILVWGGHVENMFCASSGEIDENFINCSPYNLLLSKVPSSPSNGAIRMNTSILNMISRYVSVGNENHLPNISAKVIKTLCIQQAAAQRSGVDQTMLASILPAFASGVPLVSQTLIRLLKLVFACDSFRPEMEQNAVLTAINLETIALAASKQPELARALLSGKKGGKNFQLVDELVSALDSTLSMLNSMNQKKSFDGRMLKLQCAVATDCLDVILELWKCCRLGGALSRSEYHACGGIVGHLISEDSSTNIANLIVELARSSLFATVSQEDNESFEDEVPVSSVNKKSIFLCLLSKCLGFLAIELVSRKQSNMSINFVSELIDPSPLKCFISLLTANKAPVLAAAAWVETNISESLHAFLEAFPSESSSTPCSLDSAIRLLRVTSTEAGILRWNALYNLSLADTSYATEVARFFQAVDLTSALPAHEVMSLANPLLDGALAALSFISEAKVSSQSLLPDVITEQTLKPFSEMSSLLLTTLSTIFKLGKSSGKSLIEMLHNLHESSSRIFIITKSCSDISVKEACSIRRKLLSSALLILAEYQSLPAKDRPRSESIRYSEARLGWLDITLSAIQALQFSDSNIDATPEASTSNSHYLYNFGSDAKTNKSSTERLLAFELLQASYSILAVLAPTDDAVDFDVESNGAQYAYSGDFATCMRQRSAMQHMHYHLAEASTVASLTYHSIYNGTATTDLIFIHKNAISIVDEITTFILTLADSSSLLLDILGLLIESRVIRSFQDNPLVKLCKMWTGTGSGQNSIAPIIGNRGYVPFTSGHSRVEHQTDSVHSIWCKVIDIFSSLLRSARIQSGVYANIDGSVRQQLLLVAGASLDFLSTFQDVVFSCFLAMDSKLEKTLHEKKAQKGSSIPSSSFTFTTCLLKEAACISKLFQQLSMGEAKNKFELSYIGMYKKMSPAMLKVAKMLSSFLGSVGNARELFSVLSSADTLSYDQHSSIIDSHPLLADGIPNARHESIRSSHYASSCCTIVTKDEYNQARNPTRGVSKSPAEEEKLSSDTHLQQTFQIQVNNEFIDHLENLAGSCLCNILAILTNTHPASQSFVSFSHEEIRRLDVASVLHPGALVLVARDSSSSYYNSSQYNAMEVGQCKGCDRSKRSIIVEIAEKSGKYEREVSWSQIVGMEDTSKRQSILSHHAAAKSAGDLDKESTSIGHLILALRWSRHTTEERHGIRSLSMRIAGRAAVLLSTELCLHDKLNMLGTADEERKINAQLLDLFEDTPNKDTTDTDNQHAKLIANDEIIASVRLQLRNRLDAASSERDEEMKLWEQNSGWDSSFWGGSNKREGRRSPFRAFNRMTSMDSQ